MANTKGKGTRPQDWMYPDPFDHERHIPFLRARAQAWFRDEDWELTFEDYCYFWTFEAWSCRGRGSSDLAMIRLDTEREWSVENCRIVTRREQLERQREKKRYIKSLG